jgi:hypothetical protein
LLEIAEPAVEQSTRAAARSGGEIVLINQPDSQAAHRGVAGHATSDNPATDHEQVERRFAQLSEPVFALGLRTRS